jgi:hypothetical protein
MSLEAELEQVSRGKPSKEERRAEAAQKRVLDRVFGVGQKSSGFADPALMVRK